MTITAGTSEKTVVDLVCGRWTYAGRALNADGSEMYAWDAHVLIERAGDTVRVTLAAERSQSRSLSRAAIVTPMADGRITLLYDYVADPDHEGTATHDFFGMTRILFAAAGDRAEGHYFNFNGRYTFGTMVLCRV